MWDGLDTSHQTSASSEAKDCGGHSRIWRLLKPEAKEWRFSCPMTPNGASADSQWFVALGFGIFILGSISSESTETIKGDPDETSCAQLINNRFHVFLLLGRNRKRTNCLANDVFLTFYAPLRGSIASAQASRFPRASEWNTIRPSKIVAFEFPQLGLS